MDQPNQEVADIPKEDAERWPNQQPIVDGVEPMAEISQDEYFIQDDDDDLEMEV